MPGPCLVVLVGVGAACLVERLFGKGWARTYAVMVAVLLVVDIIAANP